MTHKPVIPREQANRDVDDAIAWYLQDGADQTALDFITSLEKAYGHISRHPASGSSRYAHELNLPGLRSWPLAKFPYLLFYVEHTDHVDVWRVPHDERDIPAWMKDSGVE